MKDEKLSDLSTSNDVPKKPHKKQQDSNQGSYWVWVGWVGVGPS